MFNLFCFAWYRVSKVYVNVFETKRRSIALVEYALNPDVTSVRFNLKLKPTIKEPSFWKNFLDFEKWSKDVKSLDPITISWFSE